ncbi:MAG: sigma-54 dependent transcriptional regulator [Planctomycetaceae bacterium]|nr:sigma-54 dependent transcriptional regulator [Planctomycetaceae bacterium]
MSTIIQSRVSVSEEHGIPRAAITEALRQAGLEMEPNVEPQTTELAVPCLVGSSPLMRQLRNRIEAVAKVSEIVLISGENGTGKEIVAKMIHAQSSRKTQPWITLNCPALSPQLMESELFGHKKGAFTGADYDRVGRFEAASSGTLLLDEISEIDLNLQPKLLRVLQEHAFQRVGSNETIPSTARVLATTNRNLAAEVGEGRFREDLYYRLAILPIHVPSLRERKEDIPELFDYFLRRTAERLQVTPPQWNNDVLELLLSYNWPGNVRQLEHLVTRIAVFGENETLNADNVQRWLLEIHSTEKPLRVEYPTNTEYRQKGRVCSFSVGTRLEEVEREMIEATLAHFNGHREKTATSLGIGVRTLQGKLRQYGYKPREKAVSRQ